jgi:hypothetical protein
MKESVSIKTWGQNAKAQMAYREIKRIEKRFWDDIKKRGLWDKLQKDILTIIQKEKLDEKGMEVLQMLFGRERPMSERERIDLAINEALRQKGVTDQQMKEHFLPLTSTSGGDLYREPREKYCYSMRDEGKRLQIFRVLITCTTFTKTRDIMKETSSTSVEAFREAVGAINRKARQSLRLPAGKQNNLILSKSHSGYMINPLYPITRER